MKRLALVAAAVALIAAAIVLSRSGAGPSASHVSGAASLDPPAAPHARSSGGGVARPDLGRAAVAPRPRDARLVLMAWGSGPGQVGRRHDPEAAGEGPMALSVARDGSVLVLDQVNGRVLRRKKDGTFGVPIAIGGSTAQDLHADAAGGLTVLDRLGEHSLKRYDSDGKIVGEKQLSAVGVREPGGTTGLFEGQDGALYVEESLPAEGKRVLRPLVGGDPLPGRPSRDGNGLVTGAIADAAKGRFVVRSLGAGNAIRWETALSVDRHVLAIVLLDTDDEGGVYAGVLSAAQATGSFDLVDERLDLFRLDAQGAVVGRTSVAHPPGALESFRELSVARVGVVLWMHALPDDSGVAIDELRL